MFCGSVSDVDSLCMHVPPSLVRGAPFVTLCLYKDDGLRDDAEICVARAILLYEAGFRVVFKVVGHGGSPQRGTRSAARVSSGSGRVV